MNASTSRSNTWNARPHPGPLPRGEGEHLHASSDLGVCRSEASHRGIRRIVLFDEQSRLGRTSVRSPRRYATFSLSAGERAGVRAGVNCCSQDGVSGKR